MSEADRPHLLEVSDLHKSYPGAGGGKPIQVLSGIDLTLTAGESVAVVGPSGCGKTTLLNILGTLDTPDSGTIRINGLAVSGLSSTQQAGTRATQIGFVFQEHHLLPQCTAIENALIPTLAKGAQQKHASERATELLERVGLKDRMHHRPDALSGGQRQRVAIVRALINQPALLLVDEPTGALDRDTAESILSLLLQLNAAEQTAMLMVTHDAHLACRLDRTLKLDRGRFVDGDGP